MQPGFHRSVVEIVGHQSLLSNSIIASILHGLQRV